MKHLLYIFACVAMVFATACSKDDSPSHEGEGAVTFALSSSVTRSGEGAPSLLDTVKDKLTFRIYSVANKGEESETQTLVRLYTYDEIIGDGTNPMKIWLLAGDYRVTVEGGEKSEASFTDVYYKGATDFKVEEEMADQEIEVVCRPANVMVEVVFDQSVVNNMGSTGKATVAFVDSESYSAAEVDIAAGNVPNLTYSGTMTGFYSMLSDQEWPAKFVWRFKGTVAAKDNTEVVKDGVYAPQEGFKEGYKYTLTFKYSPDLGGYLTLDVTVDDTPDEISGVATFKPEPQFDSTVEVAEGYDNIVNEIAQMYSGKTVGYPIKAISAISELKITVDNEELTYTSAQVNGAQAVASMRSEEAEYHEFKDQTHGVTIRVINDKEWNLLLESAFSKKLGAGEHEYIIAVTDEAGATAEYVQEYIGEGISDLTITAGKEWEGEATFTANIFNPNATGLTLHYKESVESEYKSVAMTDKKATVTGLRGARVYDAYVTYTATEQVTTGSAHLRTPSGVQIPNGNMETWSGDTPRLPYNYSALGVGAKDENVSITWDSGNHGSQKAGTNITVPVADPRPGSSGSYAAQLQSKKASVMGIGKFAAGNIFYGRYVKTENTTNGIIGFGQPFVFDYKPDKLVVWYKGTIGSVNHSGGGLSEGDSDKAQIYVWLYDNTHSALQATDGRYRVRTSYSSTFITPDGKYVNAGDGNSTSHNAGDTVEGLVAYGYWNRTQTQSVVNGVTVDMAYSGWTKIEIPLVYLNDKKPNALVISCAASAYGDYFAGSTSSVMYVDDFEFVY